MSVTVILLACNLRLAHMDAVRGGDVELQRPVWIGVAVAVILLSGIMLRDRMPAARAASSWEQYQKAVRGRLPLVSRRQQTQKRWGAAAVPGSGRLGKPG